MKRFNKIIFFLGICLVFSAFLGYQKEYSLSVIGIDAFAEDEKKQEEDGAEKKGETEEENPCPECPECPDPAKVVLRGLEDKKTMIEKQRKALVQEKKELETFEEQIDEKLENLKTLKKQIEADVALLKKEKTRKENQKEAAYEAKIGRLVKMYAGMKPKSAAQIVDKMNLEVAREIFLRMREASASQILSFVDSEKAAKISERLAFKRK
jgi:flagellar motility protein MotE (MotC chaperone)